MQHEDVPLWWQQMHAVVAPVGLLLHPWLVRSILLRLVSFHYGAWRYGESAMAHARLALVRYGACQIGTGPLWHMPDWHWSAMAQVPYWRTPVWRCSGVAQFRRHAMAQFHAVPVWSYQYAFSLDTNLYLNDGLYRRSISLIPCWYARVWTQGEIG